MDTQGRIIIPQSLREHANLTKNIISIGVSNRIEIWDADSWKAYTSGDDFDADDVAEKMADLGI